MSRSPSKSCPGYPTCSKPSPPISTKARRPSSAPAPFSADTQPAEQSPVSVGRPQGPVDTLFSCPHRHRPPWRIVSLDVITLVSLDLRHGCAQLRRSQELRGGGQRNVIGMRYQWQGDHVQMLDPLPPWA